LESSLVARKNERESAQARLDAYTYPVLTLPLCPPVLGLLSPNLLTRICRIWRQIALITPALWRAISLYYLDGDFEPHIYMLRSWLDRSGNCPLSIKMDDYGDTPSHKFLEAILPHRTRWEYVQLIIMQGDLLAIDGPIPLVRSLDIRVYGGNTPVSSVALEAPRLLAKEPYECTYVLEHSVNLTYCELILYGDYEATQADVGITLAHLEKLVLWKWLEEENGPTGYLETFIVPALRRLQVPDDFLLPDDDLGPDAIDALHSFVSKSGCKLEEVFITGPRSRPKDSYRQAFPSINISFNSAITDWEYNKDEESKSDSSSDPET
ncbi:hypothetical protein B0H13DRAFT_2057636, partial [Mycena leptocephala]